MQCTKEPRTMKHSVTSPLTSIQNDVEGQAVKSQDHGVGLDDPGKSATEFPVLRTEEQPGGMSNWICRTW